MAFEFKSPLRVVRLLVLAAIALSGIAACTPMPAGSDINDPHEARNREVHAFNQNLSNKFSNPDRVRNTGPKPLRKGLFNVASNLGMPRLIVNDMLQGNLADALSNTLRFGINSTIGLGGLFDVATANELYERPTDFGETLHVWGAQEGHYVELPILGPSTQRDALGTAVDFFLNPLIFILPADLKYVGPLADVVDNVGDRDEYAELLDAVMNGSADSYAQFRLQYLQYRRRLLLGELEEDDLEDPYAE